MPPVIDHDPPSTRVLRIYLTGFMGAGKSTVGALLSSLLDWAFLDIDTLIEAQAGQSVSQLFAAHGEAHFRTLESKAIHAAQARSTVVIALGGGAIETDSVRELLANDPGGLLIFLQAPLPLLVQRCQEQKNNALAKRPVLADLANLEARYTKRLAHYQTAHLTVATEDLAPEEVAATIHRSVAAYARWK